MSQTFKIKPGDQSLVGRKIILARGYNCADAEPRLVLFVGHRFVTYANQENGGRRKVFEIEDHLDFEFYEEPKKMTPKARAFSRDGAGRVYPTVDIFKNAEEASDHLCSQFVSWPAIPNKDGFYEVPE